MIQNTIKKIDNINNQYQNIIIMLKKISSAVYTMCIEINVKHDINQHGIQCIYAVRSGIYVIINDGKDSYEKAVENLKWEYVEPLIIEKHLEAFLVKLNTELDRIADNVSKALQILKQ